MVYRSDNPVMNSLNSIDTLLIYSPLVDYQYVGDEIAPLLQVVSAEEPQTTFINKIYDTPHYVPVIRNNIETIEIDIRSDLGKPIQFTSGRVVVKLHFKKKNFYQ